MDLHEIVPSHIERDGGFVVLQFLAVSVGKAGKPAQVHPQSEIPAFDIAGRDVTGIGHSVDFGWDLFEDCAGAIPVGAGV